MNSGEENHRAENPEESVKDGVFDERSNTDVLALTLLSVGLVILGVFHNIEDGGDDGDDQLQDSDDDDGRGQVQAKDRLETWLAAAHLTGIKEHFSRRLELELELEVLESITGMSAVSQSAEAA